MQFANTIHNWRKTIIVKSIIFIWFPSHSFPSWPIKKCRRRTSLRHSSASIWECWVVLQSCLSSLSTNMLSRTCTLQCHAQFVTKKWKLIQFIKHCPRSKMVLAERFQKFTFEYLWKTCHCGRQTRPNGLRIHCLI